ncbi:hypothetical protein RFI_08812 [Reticulomyxa filosa]|uniref:Uncharacterized protein n=1 Tax=Reticulomyxa filosa TaxID=46433 RepID=X6NSN1_RETFI|nr:hypothetical protein RFI_08812 [Reticulomyxa filosa]|eukprot:ETO28322.1 hypothetical protein RFI_08812 [Reticulomyxa filosa]
MRRVYNTPNGNSNDQQKGNWNNDNIAASDSESLGASIPNLEPLIRLQKSVLDQRSLSFKPSSLQQQQEFDYTLCVHLQPAEVEVDFDLLARLSLISQAFSFANDVNYNAIAIKTIEHNKRRAATKDKSHKGGADWTKTNKANVEPDEENDSRSTFSMQASFDKDIRNHKKGHSKPQMQIKENKHKKAFHHNNNNNNNNNNNDNTHLSSFHRHHNPTGYDHYKNMSHSFASNMANSVSLSENGDAFDGELVEHDNINELGSDTNHTQEQEKEKEKEKEKEEEEEELKALSFFTEITTASVTIRFSVRDSTHAKLARKENLVFKFTELAARSSSHVCDVSSDMWQLDCKSLDVLLSRNNNEELLLRSEACYERFDASPLRIDPGESLLVVNDDNDDNKDHLHMSMTSKQDYKDSHLNTGNDDDSNNNNADIHDGLVATLYPSLKIYLNHLEHNSKWLHPKRSARSKKNSGDDHKAMNEDNNNNNNNDNDNDNDDNENEQTHLENPHYRWWEDAKAKEIKFPKGDKQATHAKFSWNARFLSPTHINILLPKAVAAISKAQYDLIMDLYMVAIDTLETVQKLPVSSLYQPFDTTAVAIQDTSTWGPTISTLHEGTEPTSQDDINDNDDEDDEDDDGADDMFSSVTSLPADYEQKTDLHNPKQTERVARKRTTTTARQTQRKELLEKLQQRQKEQVYSKSADFRKRQRQKEKLQQLIALSPFVSSVKIVISAGKPTSMKMKNSHPRSVA